MTHHVSVEMLNSLLIHQLVTVVASSIPITGDKILSVKFECFFLGGGGCDFHKCEPVHLLHDSLEEANHKAVTDSNIISKHDKNFIDRQCSAREYRYFKTTGFYTFKVEIKTLQKC